MQVMTSIMTCPYCGKTVSTEHIYNLPTVTANRGTMKCSSCRNRFSYTAVQAWTYSTQKAECLNGAPHNMEHLKSYNKTFGIRSRCRDCGEMDVVISP